MDSRRVEAGSLGEASQNQEGAGAGERAALRVQEQFRTVALVEVRPPTREVAAEGLDGLAPDRNDALLRPFSDAADEPAVQVDRRALEADGFAHAEAGAVEQLDERAIAERPRRRTGRCVDQLLDFAGRERLRQGAATLR